MQAAAAREPSSLTALQPTGLTALQPHSLTTFQPHSLTFRAKKVAEAFFQCSETLEVKWITPKVLLPIASAYLEPISEEEWASIVEHLPDCVSVGNAKQAWEKELKQ